ncbi:hypothetical protein EV675_1797 [Pigmentiphaga kullae]|uniref:Uncharacterized protein n=1 Tax=Pigmentiphaga kullae TaxID=151784 RepID=A0A4V2F3Y9_9BURK|nr:hypothetical protein EV675_1797 [Pigmentiphaga kullae]
MRSLVREADPGAARRELDAFLEPVALVAGIGLHAVVQLQHEVVVGAAAALGDVQLVQQPGHAGAVGRHLRQVARRQRVEGFAHPPQAGVAVRVDVVEDAQDALFAHRPRREGVDVQAGVVLAPGHLPGADAMQAQAGGGRVQVRGVLGQQAVQETARGLVVAAHQRADGGLALVFHGHAGQLAGRGVQADVLALGVDQRGVEQAGLGLAQFEPQFGEVQDLALFQFGHGRGRAGLAGRVVPGAVIDADDAGGRAHGVSWPAPSRSWRGTRPRWARPGSA